MNGYPVMPAPEFGQGWYRAGPLRAWVTRDGQIGGWHLSVSRQDRIPTWPEIMWMKRHLIPPDVFMVVLVPPDSHWMNGYPNVIQLIEVRDGEEGALIQYMKDTRAMAECEGLSLVPCDGRDLRR